MASVLYEPDNNDQEYALVLSGPLNDRLRGRVAGRYRTIDGHLKNLTNNRDEPERNEMKGRLWLDFDATDTLTLSLKAEAGSFDVKGRQIEIATETPGPSGRTYAQILAGLTGDTTLLNNYLDYNRTSNAGDKSYNDAAEYAFNVDWKIGDYTLTAITGYSRYDFQELCDCDFTGANVFWIDISEKFDQTSQEIRLASPTGGQFDFIVGGYYETADLEYRDGIRINSTSLLIPIVNQLSPGAGTALSNVGAPRLFQQDSESYAVFAQGGWKIMDSLHLTAGLRWTHEEKDASRDFRITDINGNPLQGAQAVVTPLVFATVFNGRAHSLSGSRSEDKVLPSVTLEWHSQEKGVLTYLHYGEGAKSGGYDARGNNPTVPPATGCATPPVSGQPRNPPGCLYGREIGTFEFQDEEADNYELGLKSRIGDSAEVNVAVYYTDFKNLQVSTFDGSLGFNVRNAGKATVQGVEIEGRWRATENLLFSGAVSYTDFEFKDYIGQCYFGQTPNAPDGINCDYSGQPNQYVADWVGMLSGEYRHPVGETMQLRIVLDGYYTSEYFASPTLDPKQVVDDYFRLNGRISIGADDGRWEIALIGKNLTDELIAPYGNDTPLSATATLFTTGARGFSAWRFVEPARTIALQATYRL
jgi:outer membrane receptor protein involved in Fe transport